MNSIICPTDSQIITIMMSCREAERILTWINHQENVNSDTVQRLAWELSRATENNRESEAYAGESIAGNNLGEDSGVPGEPTFRMSFSDR